MSENEKPTTSNSVSPYRPYKYDDVLCTMHDGAWFGFYKDADISTGIGAPHEYENLVIIPVDGVTYDKPTKDYIDTELAKLQATWDAAQ